MKKCPNCQMTVATHSECPICKADLTDTPYSDSKGERYKLNALFLRYFLKKCAFFLCCCAFVLVRIVFWRVRFTLYPLLTLLLLVLTLGLSLFPERMKHAASWQYTDDYLDRIYGPAAQYIFGILAVISAFLW